MAFPLCKEEPFETEYCDDFFNGKGCKNKEFCPRYKELKAQELKINYKVRIARCNPVQP